MGVEIQQASQIEIEAIRSQYGGASIVLFVGRLIEEKGVGDLLEALALLRHSHPDILGLFVGEGQQRREFEEQAAALGLESSTQFIGWVDPSSIPAYMAAADVFVGPSKRASDGWTEAYGLVFAEALAAGTATVATRAGGITDIVDDQVNGLIVDESSPSQIARAIRRIVDDRAFAEKLGTAGRAKAVRQLSRDASAQAFSDLFDSVIAGRRG